MNKKKSGFTLTEVLIVIVIIGIILAIAIPSIVLIRKRINERLLENKKQLILVAAENYGRDRNFTQDTTIYVYTLIDSKYINAEVDKGHGACTSGHSDNGCVLNPVDDSSLNEEKILIKVTGNSVIAIWDGQEGSTTDKDLIDSVKDKLNCDIITESEPCLFTGSNPDNYLYYSGIMWRIIGIYKIDGSEVIKMVTDDNVVWDDETAQIKLLNLIKIKYFYLL